MVLQHRFHPTRQWRFDFAHIPTLTAIEIQGFGEGHNSYDGMASDYAKHNEAIRFGWTILYLMSHDVSEHKIKKTIRYVLSIICARPPAVPNNVPLKPGRTSYEEIIRKITEGQ